MPDKYFEEIGNLEFQIAEYKGKQETIIGIHGLTGNYAHLATLAKELTPQYKFISYDVRGRGESSPAEENSSIKKHADDLIELIESLDIEAPILVGHSMGGFIALLVAAKYDNVKGVVLLDGGGIVTQQQCDMIAPALQRLDQIFESMDKYVEQSKERYAAVGLDWHSCLEESVLHEAGENEEGLIEYKGDSKKIIQDLNSLVEFDHDQVCPRINCPTLLVAARGALGDEPLYKEGSYDKTKELISNVEFKETEKNHYTMVLEEKPVVTEMIKEFLEKKI